MAQLDCAPMLKVESSSLKCWANSYLLDQLQTFLWESSGLQKTSYCPTKDTICCILYKVLIPRPYALLGPALLAHYRHYFAIFDLVLCMRLYSWVARTTERTVAKLKEVSLINPARKHHSAHRADFEGGVPS